MPTVVTPEAIEQPCAELWYDPSALLEAFPAAEWDDAERAVLEATWLLWRLTYERFHGPQEWVDDYRVTHNKCSMVMEHSPVTEVLSVSRVDLCSDEVAATGAGDEISGACFIGADTVRLCTTSGGEFGCTPAPCTCREMVVRVHYTLGSNLPPGADRATRTMASEYLKALTNPSSCQLPERVTSVTRQGVSWVLLDPMDFLKDGLTGIGSVDGWISAANGRGVYRLLDPLYNPPVISSTLVGCGGTPAVEPEP